MIADLKQPAKHWLADVINNFGAQLKNGENPSIELKLFDDVVIEIRLNKLPGIFDRETVEIIDSKPEST